mgnify:FL=1|jgi:cob(I)alamin adenosyltransferase|uniref:cob(I)yrinic acid a,c-diamide adenosyltransferase n=1 Tax=Alloprevotella sp. TaxID=1872471 RepID=UPI004028D511
MSIYTRRGDSGTTQLATGERTSKSAPHIIYYGMLDELSSQLGWLIAQVEGDVLPPKVVDQLTKERELLIQAQRLLFNLGVEGTDKALLQQYPAPSNADVTALEHQIDTISKAIGGLFRGFVLPGGHTVAAAAHVVRTVCRRTERELISLVTRYPDENWRISEGETMAYVNRLSDFLFALARKLNYLTQHDEKSAHEMLRV